MNEISFGKSCLNEMLENVKMQMEAIATEIKTPGKLRWWNIGPVSA